MKIKQTKIVCLHFSNPICAFLCKGQRIQRNGTNAKKGMVINMKRLLSVILAIVIITGTVPFAVIPASAVTTEDGLEYSVFNGEVTITGYRGRSTVIIIPDTIDGIPVTAVGDNAFSSLSELSSVYIPPSIKKIGDYAFYDNYSFDTVYFGGTYSEWTDIIKGDKTGLRYVTVIYNYVMTADGFEFAVERKTNTATLAKYTGTSTDVVIPESINGCVVVTIANSVFLKNLKLQSITIPSSVTLIEGNAFKDCTALSSVTMSRLRSDDTVIEDDAFKNCTSLTSVSIADLSLWCSTDFGNVYSNPLFYADKLYLNGEAVTDLVIPKETGTISARAFYNYKGLESLTFEGKVTVESHAFAECKNLESITGCDYLDFVGERAFYNTAFYENDENWENNGLYMGKALVGFKRFADGCIDIKKGTEIIVDKAFDSCVNIDEVFIPESVTYVGESAFYNTHSLKKIYYEGTSMKWSQIEIKDKNDYLDTAVKIYCFGTDLEGVAYTYYTATKNVKIWGYIGDEKQFVVPSKIEGYPVTMIGAGTFADLEGLESIVIPKEVKRIENNAVSGCPLLKTIYYEGSPSEWTSIYLGEDNGISAKNVVFNYSTPMEGFIYTTDEENNTITITGYNGNNTDIVIPSSYNGYIVRYMDPYAFEGREYITSVVIPDTMWIIPEGAFKDCKNLERVTISEGVRDIGDYAFSGCTAIAEIIIPESVEYIFMYAFNGCTSLEYVALPYTLCTIEYKAFYMCDSVARVTYNGSEERWKNIDIASGNAAIERAKIEFDTAPDVSVIIGDLNGDSEINAKDANLIKQIIAGESPAAGEALAFADLNSDDEINAKDANLMKQIIAGEIQI